MGDIELRPLRMQARRMAAEQGMTWREWQRRLSNHADVVMAAVNAAKAENPSLTPEDVGRIARDSYPEVA